MIHCRSVVTFHYAFVKSISLQSLKLLEVDAKVHVKILKIKDGTDKKIHIQILVHKT